jgi:Cft2 family RNA processing exonuclease
MNIAIAFLGAELTGSCTVIKIESEYYLVDAGECQDEQCRKRLAKNASRIKRIFITHAHLDHIGFLPSLVKLGFSGTVCCTETTQELIKMRFKNDVFSKINFEIIAFERELPCYNFKVTILDTGHIPGSCAFSFQLGRTRLIFSGDIGPKGFRIPYYYPKEETIMVLEATRGDGKLDEKNLHELKSKKIEEIKKDATLKKRTVIIMASPYRAQEVLIDFPLAKVHSNKVHSNTIESIRKIYSKHSPKYWPKEFAIDIECTIIPSDTHNKHDKKLLEKALTDENAVVVLCDSYARETLETLQCSQAKAKCKIEDLTEFYLDHADLDTLVECATGSSMVFLNHGSLSAKCNLKEKLETKDIEVEIPREGLDPEYLQLSEEKTISSSEFSSGHVDKEIPPILYTQMFDDAQQRAAVMPAFGL